MKRILITGGTGSFGNAMVSRMLGEPSLDKIVVFSRDELKQHQMMQTYGNEKLSFILGDVRDINAITRAMVGVDVVFHAAALKQVPTGEYFPMEHIMTNTLGTENVIRAAETSDTVQKLVFLSTDKAVYPVNTLGLTKAMGEHLISSRGYSSQSDTIFCSVRYGNVLASRGSVIPLFIDKLREGKDLTVTDPNMTRFLLSLDDAIDLVLTAINEGDQGDLFIKKAPASTMGIIAEALIQIFNSNVETKIIGVREGEKIHETLMTKIERIRSVDIGDYFKIRSQAKLNPEFYFEKGTKRSMVIDSEDYTSENTTQLDLVEVEKLLLSLPYIKSELEITS